MDIIPNNVKVLLDVKIYKQDKPGSTSSSSSTSTSSFGNSLARGIGSNSSNDSFGSSSVNPNSNFSSTNPSFGMGSNLNTSFSLLKGGSVKQDIVPYRSSMTFQKLSTDTVLFDPLVKLTDASIKSSGKYTQLQFLIPDKFNELILKMNKESGKVNKTYFYSEPDLTEAILENNTIIIKADTMFKPSTSYIQLKNAPKNIQDKSVYNGFDIYNTFIDDTKPNDKLIITNEPKMNRLKLEATINGSTKPIIFYSKTSLELLLDATKDGTVSNNMKLTMNNLFGLNSKMFLDSDELSIYKQSQSKWLYNLNSYETLNKEQFLFKHKLKPDYFGQLKYNIIKKLTAHYNDEANRRKYEEFNDADKNPKLKGIYIKNYAMVDDNIQTIIKDEFTLFLTNLNIKDFPSIDYFNKYKEYLNKEYSNIKDLDSKNIPVEVRFVECPFFYIYSFKWNKEAYDKAAAIAAATIAATGTLTSTPTTGSVTYTGTNISDKLLKEIARQYTEIDNSYKNLVEDIDDYGSCNASIASRPADCKEKMLLYINNLKDLFKLIIELQNNIYKLYKETLIDNKNITNAFIDTNIDYIKLYIKQIMEMITNIQTKTKNATSNPLDDELFYNAIATLNYLITAYKTDITNKIIKNKLDSALNNWKFFIDGYYSQLYYYILINSHNKFISDAQKGYIEILKKNNMNIFNKKNFENYIIKLNNFNFNSNPQLFKTLQNAVENSITNITISPETNYYTKVIEELKKNKFVDEKLQIKNINTLTYDYNEYYENKTTIPDINELKRKITNQNKKINDEKPKKGSEISMQKYALSTPDSTDIDDDFSGGGGKLIQHGGAENTSIKDLLIKYFELYTNYQTFISPQISPNINISNNSPNKLSILDKDSGIRDNQNFFYSIFKAIDKYKKDYTGFTQYTDGTDFSKTFDEFYEKINNYILNNTKSIFSQYTSEKEKYKKEFDKPYNVNDTKLKFKNNSNKIYQALANDEMPFKFKDDSNTTNPFEDNLKFFQEGKYYLDPIFLDYINSILNKQLHVSLIIIDKEFKVDCSKINIDDNMFYIFLFKDKNEKYYLIEYANITLYSSIDFNTDDMINLGIKSPPLFIYIYLFEKCKSKAEKLFNIIYSRISIITTLKQNITQISLFNNNIKEGTKKLLTLGSTSTTTIGQSNANIAITKSVYCYYITVSLDLYEGKLPFMQKQTIGCDIKRNNIMNEFTELTGIKVLPSIADNKYLSLLPQNAAKPGWFNSISSFFKSKEGTKTATTGSSSTPSISSKAKHKGGTTRRKIILTYKRQNNIKNVKDRLSRKLHNITHKLFKN